MRERRKDLQRGKCRCRTRERNMPRYQCLFIKQTYTGMSQTYGHNVQTHMWILDCTQETPSNTSMNTGKPPAHPHTQPYIRDNVGRNMRDPHRRGCRSKERQSRLVSNKLLSSSTTTLRKRITSLSIDRTPAMSSFVCESVCVRGFTKKNKKHPHFRERECMSVYACVCFCI